MESNPYAAPRSAVNDVTLEKHGRPILVWIITIFMLIGVMGGVVSTAAALLGRPIGGAQAAEHLSAMGTGDYLWALVFSLAAIPAYVDLFRLKRRALPFLVGLFLAGQVVMVANLLLRAHYRAMFEVSGGYWSLLAGVVFNLAIIGYVWRLRAKGVLR